MVLNSKDEHITIGALPFKFNLVVGVVGIMYRFHLNIAVTLTAKLKLNKMSHATATVIDLKSFLVVASMSPYYTIQLFSYTKPPDSSIIFNKLNQQLIIKDAPSN